MPIDHAIVQEAQAFLKKLWPKAKPCAGLVLGSGWGEVVKSFEVREAIAFENIPGFGKTGVHGHAGVLHYVTHHSQDLLVFQGRRHWYEGEGWTGVTLPPQILKSFGVEMVMLTNAAGGINPEFAPGDLMVIDDHINCMSNHPLIGPHHAELGPRFPDMSEVYSKKLRAELHRAAESTGLKLKHGVYLAVSGPSYETPAEIQMFAKMGADAVGMSTVPEAIVARSLGLKVVGLSCISNLAAGISKNPLSHEEVAETLGKSMQRIRAVVAKFLETAGM